MFHWQAKAKKRDKQVRKMSNSQSDMDYGREELRGFFVLGLLAVLVVIRFQSEKLMVSIGQSPVDIIPLLNITIILLSLYAFFMVLGISDDVIGKTLAESFRNLSKYFLRLDFLLTGFLGTLYFIIGYGTRAVWIIGFIAAFSLIGVLLSLRKTKLKEAIKKRKITKLDLLGSISLLLLLVFVACAAALFLYPDEQYLVVFFVLGIVSFLVFVFVRDKQSREKNKV